MDSTQLGLFFSEHGKVSSAEVIFYKETKRSQGMGLVTMVTGHGHQDDALAALDGLLFDGSRLKVSVVKEKRYRIRRRRRQLGYK